MYERNFNYVGVFLFLIFLIGCGGSGNGPGDGNPSIDVPEGYVLYGTVDEHNISILDADGGGSATVYDYNNNNTWDSTESISLSVRNPDAYGSSTETYVLILFTPGDGNSFDTATTYNITGIVYLMTDGSSLTTYNIDSGIVSFSSFGSEEGDTISWEFEVTLENDAGTLSGKFSDQLQFSGGAHTS